MKSMRWRVAITILWLSLLFNIERFDFDKGANVNLTSAFYILVAVASALFMLVRMNQRVMYALGAGVFTAYTIVKVVSPIPVFQGFHKYITITEIVALMITMALAWYVNRGLQDFEEAVEAISLPKGRAGVLDYEQMQERIRTELGRARRHQHPMSLAAIELDPSTSEAALHRAVRDLQWSTDPSVLRVAKANFVEAPNGAMTYALHLQRTNATLPLAAALAASGVEDGDTIAITETSKGAGV